MRQRALAIAAAVYLVLCLALSILWLRSYSCNEQVAWRTRGGWQSVRTARGTLQWDVLLADWSAVPAEQLHGPRYERTLAGPPSELARIVILSPCSSQGDVDLSWRFGQAACCARLNFKNQAYRANLVVPFWLLAAGTLFPPAIAAAQRIGWRRRMAAAHVA